MTPPDLTPAQRRLTALARQIGEGTAAPAAAQTDREARWPREAMRGLGEAGLLGLTVPTTAGGHGEGLLTLALVGEELARSCASTALCFGMHCVAAAVIAAKASPYQQGRYLEPIARGQHVTSLALSEPGTGIHFYVPTTTFSASDGHYLLNGRKSFVTNGGEADSYVVSAAAEAAGQDPQTFSFFLLDSAADGLSWCESWDGFGMRGNSARGAVLSNAFVPHDNLLGREGDQIWYVFKVVAPFFLATMSATYVGIAERALEIAVDHLRTRVHEHTDAALGEEPPLVHQIARLWTVVERARQLLYAAARLADTGDAAADCALFAAKIEAANAAVHAVNEASALVGARGYASNSELARLVRDAHAAPVMSPTTQLLEWWLGRRVLGQPIF